MSAQRVSVFPILSITFVGTLGFSIVLPFLIFLVTRLGGNALIYGVMGATYSAFQLIGAPILGRWSDRIGRKRVLLLSQLGTLTSWGIFLIALALPVTRMFDVDSAVIGQFTITVPLVVLFFARALDGITGGNVSVANAYLADITSEEERAVNFGKMAVASNMGFIFGPAIAGALGAAASGEFPPVLAAFLISVVASLLIAFRLPGRPCGGPLSADPAGANTRRVMGQELKPCYRIEGAATMSARAILRIPGIALLLAIYFLVFLAFNFFYIAFPVYAVADLGWGLTQTGLFFSFMGLLMAGVQGPVLGRASTIWSDRTLVLAGSLLLAASFLFFTSRATSVIYAGTVLLAVGNGIMWPSLMAVISKTAHPSVQGAVQGLAGSAGAVASIVGLVVGGLLFGVLGGTVFVLSAGITGVVFVVAFAVRG